MTPTAKHTPLPWANPGNGNLVGADGTLVATFPRPKCDGATQRRHANIELVNRCLSSHPVLLAAAERMAKAMEQGRYPELQGVACDLFAAIAMAKGE